MTEATHEDQDLTPADAFVEKVEALILEDEDLSVYEAIGALELIKYRLAVAVYEVSEEDEGEGDDEPA